MEWWKMKPEYKVMSMDEIRSVDWNGFNAISTFSGCGGSSTGYRMAGFKVLYANEFIDSARDSYNANKADYTFLDGRDIRQVQPEDILEKIGLKKGELDLFDGSPPCASFSTAGKRQAGWGKVKKYSDKAQRTDDLFFEYIRLLRELKPKTFVAENVSGLVKGAAKGYFIDIMRELKASGYRVTCKVLDAQWLGVPQSRQRTIFVGVREDLKSEPAHPKPLPYRYSVRDALPWIEKIQSGSFCAEWMSSDNVMGTIVQSDGTRGHRSQCEAKRKVRKFTMDELRRICGFPDDYLLTGTYAQQWERCGRAVPPVMMYHIAKTIRDEILMKIK
jgi:DNA (cytosine-5)-methyltransferase 1